MKSLGILLFGFVFGPCAIAGSGPTIVINEVLVDAVGSDDGKRFVAIRSVAGTDLSNFTITSYYHKTCPPSILAQVTIPAGSVVPPSKVFVVGDATPALMTFVVPPPNYADPGLNLSALPGSSIVLRDASNNIVDVVGYGPIAEFLPSPTCAPLQYETFPAPLPPAGCALKRICDGAGCEFTGLPMTHPSFPAGGLADSDDNEGDFFLNCSPLSGQHPEMLLIRNTTTGGKFDTSASASASTGASVGIEIGSPCDPGKAYLVLCSATAPTGDPTGVPIDPLTIALMPYVNTPVMFNFAGNLSAAGSATQITFLVPALTALPTPFNLYFAAIRPIKLNTNPTNVVTLTITQ